MHNWRVALVRGKLRVIVDDDVRDYVEVEERFETDRFGVEWYRPIAHLESVIQVRLLLDLVLHMTRCIRDGELRTRELLAELESKSNKLDELEKLEKLEQPPYEYRSLVTNDLDAIELVRKKFHSLREALVEGASPFVVIEFDAIRTAFEKLIDPR